LWWISHSSFLINKGIHKYWTKTHRLYYKDSLIRCSHTQKIALKYSKWRSWWQTFYYFIRRHHSCQSMHCSLILCLSYSMWIWTLTCSQTSLKSSRSISSQSSSSHCHSLDLSSPCHLLKKEKKSLKSWTLAINSKKHWSMYLRW